MALSNQKDRSPVRESACPTGKRNAALETPQREEDERLAELLKAVAHPVRIRILRLLSECGGELCVCEIETHFDLRQPTISHHLKTMKDAGLIRSHQVGLRVHYSLAENPPLDIRALLG